jgi:hypothetical protein
VKPFSIVAAALAVALASPVGAAETIAVCGASAGYSYFAESPLMRDDAGWQEDGLSQGRFSIVATERGKFDILFTDATGEVVSSVQDGGHVFLTGYTEEAVAFMVVYPFTSTETYVVWRFGGEVEAVWSSAKYGTPIPKLGAYRASCSFLDITPAK